MVIVGWFVVALAAWLLDSAIRNRPPIQTLKEIVISGELPVIGKSYPAARAAGAASASGAAPAALVTHTPPGGSGATVPGDVNSWIAQANAILAQNGVSPAELDSGAQQIIIHYESGGNPTIVNTTDSNARAGHPSEGLGQTIPSTFHAYMLPGHGNIDNPVDNIIAFTRYSIARYGGLAKVPGVVAVRAGRNYVPY